MTIGDVFNVFFNVFLKIQKHDFLRFLRRCTRFLEHFHNGVVPPSCPVHSELYVVMPISLFSNHFLLWSS